MAHIVTDDCIACSACIAACPFGAVSEQNDKIVVNADECIDCGVCEDACPQDAIIAE